MFPSSLVFDVLQYEYIVFVEEYNPSDGAPLAE